MLEPARSPPAIATRRVAIVELDSASDETVARGLVEFGAADAGAAVAAALAGGAATGGPTLTEPAASEVTARLPAPKHAHA